METPQVLRVVGMAGPHTARESAGVWRVFRPSPSLHQRRDGEASEPSILSSRFSRLSGSNAGSWGKRKPAAKRTGWLWIEWPLA